MVGISACGAYVPIYRLSKDEISRAWGRPPSGGEKAVANFDEDSITMAVAAGIDCLQGIERSSIDGLYFASTTSPYKEKLSSSIIASALDLRRDSFTGDFDHSLRSGSIALRSGLNALKDGAKRVLVTASDCRLGAPEGDLELNLGDGAAAIMLGTEDLVAELEQSYTHYDDFLDLWRKDNDLFIKTWEDRFIITHGFMQNLQEVVQGILRQSHLKPQEIQKVVLYAPDSRYHQTMGRSLGFDLKTQVQDPFFNQMGNTGSAFALMQLVAALEGATPGDRILVAFYGDGCDAYIFKVTDKVARLKDHRGMKGHLSSKKMLSNYEKYLRYKNLTERQPLARPPDSSSVPLLWRQRKQLISLYGQKCKVCGTCYFPRQHVCLKCMSKDKFDEIRLSDKKGEIFTYTIDNLAASMDPPTVQCVLNIEGCRFYCSMTDRDPQDVKVGMPVELTFRKFHEGAGVMNYFWKCRPVR